MKTPKKIQNAAARIAYPEEPDITGVWYPGIGDDTGSPRHKTYRTGNDNLPYSLTDGGGAAIGLNYTARVHAINCTTGDSGVINIQHDSPPEGC